MEWVNVALEEYKALREEIIHTLDNQQSILTIGVTAIGVIIGFGLNLWDKKILSDLIFLIFSPVFCYIALFIWFGEVTRMTRNGLFLASLEQNINDAIRNITTIKENALNWEIWLREKDKSNKTHQNNWNYYAVISLFLGTAFISMIIGLYHALEITCLSATSLTFIIITIFIICIFVGVTLCLYKTGKGLR